MENSVNRYPPREFFDKYKEYLAPTGSLLEPNEVISRHKSVNNLQTTIKKAFKITVRRLEKMRNTCCNCFEEIGKRILGLRVESREMRLFGFETCFLRENLTAVIYFSETFFLSM